MKYNKYILPIMELFALTLSQRPEHYRHFDIIFFVLNKLSNYMACIYKYI